MGILMVMLCAASAVEGAGREPVPPVMGSWFWADAEFEPGGCRDFIDKAAKHSPLSVLTTSIRARKEVTDKAVHDHIAEAAAYARSRGIEIVMDLDVRLAREAFRKAHPDELQEMLRLREVEITASAPARLAIPSAELADHYTGNNVPYVATAGRLARVYAYRRGDGGIQPETVEDITGLCTIEEASPARVTVALPASGRLAGFTACAAVVFTHFCADVFAPHLLEFQRSVLEQYADTPITGACKDEWGFPPCFDGCPAKNDFWYSKWREQEYAKLSGGRDLVRDCLLMYAGERGRERERQAAINRFMIMSLRRNAEVERDFYDAVKEVFGPSARVCTHPTWYPVPDSREFMKNGLDWWQAPRDFAQTDEITPYPVRTALAKKWGGPWYNMFYSKEITDYRRELWAACLAGGRVNYHPLYPVKGPSLISTDHDAIFGGELMLGESRARLLSLITQSPLDCPVAVVFGHACAMNWAGPHYDDVGAKLADALWRTGYPADLVPSTELAGLSIAESGRVRYGPQEYAAVVVYHPEFEGPAFAQFLAKAAKGKAMLFRAGDWTADSDGEPFDGWKAVGDVRELPAGADQAASEIVSALRKAGVRETLHAQEYASSAWSSMSISRPVKGRSVLADGTQVLVSGANSPAGGPISETLDVNGHEVRIEAIGVAAVRLDGQGSLQALAAGGLKRLRCPGFDISLDSPLDLALWRDTEGRVRGVVQGLDGLLPGALTKTTEDWRVLEVKPPLPDVRK